MENSLAKIIAVTSVKGGTGKTTTVLNLAGVYSNMGKKVLVIDFDLYSAAISLMLNLEPTNDIYTLCEDLNNNRYEDFENYITKYNDTIDIIAGPKDIRMSSRVNSRYIPIILSKAALKYDVVLIDTNHFMSEINLTILENSDKILYVITDDPIDLKNMRSMISIYKDMERDNYSILLNEPILRNRNLSKKYDMSKFLKKDIDFYVNDKFYIKDIDNYILEGKILTLDKKIKTSYKKVMSDFKYMANSLVINKDKE